MCVCLRSVLYSTQLVRPPSHHVVWSFSNNAHLVNHVPILETVLEEASIERIPIFPICCSKVAISTVVCPLISREVEGYRKELKMVKLAQNLS